MIFSRVNVGQFYQGILYHFVLFLTCISQANLEKINPFLSAIHACFLSCLLGDSISRTILMQKIQLTWTPFLTIVTAYLWLSLPFLHNSWILLDYYIGSPPAASCLELRGEKNTFQETFRVTTLVSILLIDKGKVFQSLRLRKSRRKLHFKVS